MTTTSPAPPLLPARPHTNRIRRALLAFGRSVARGLATDNGGFWAYGVWYPGMYWASPSARPDDRCQACART